MGILSCSVGAVLVEVVAALAAALAFGSSQPLSEGKAVAAGSHSAAGCATMEGVVTAPDGSPVSRARVTYLSGAGDAKRIDRRQAVETDTQGRFEICVKGAEVGTLRVEANGLAGRTLEQVRPGARLMVALGSGSAVGGRIRDSSGQPVVRARVEARSAASRWGVWDLTMGVVATETDARGEYRLTGLEPTLLTVSASAPGIGRASKAGVRGGSQVDLVLEPARGIVGVVTDPEGKPLRAVVRAEAPPFWLGDGVSTNARGRFALTLGPGSYVVMVHCPGFAPAVVPGVEVTDEADAEIHISLQRSVSVIGRILDTKGKGITGTVILRQWMGHQLPPSLMELLRTEAAPGGRFSLEIIPGDVVIGVTAPGLAERAVDARTNHQPVVDVGDILLDSGARIRGLVTTKLGLPIRDALVVAQGRYGADSQPEAESRTSADGSFVLAGLKSDHYTVSASAPGFARRAMLVPAGTENVSLSLDAAGALSGVVVDEEEKPVEAYLIQVRRTNDGMDLEAQKTYERQVGSADGRFALDGLAAGTYFLRVVVPDYQPVTRAELKLSAGLTTDLGLVRVVRGGVVGGLVLDSRGDSIPGARVTIQPEGDPLSWASASGAQTDALGAFEIRGVSAGTFSLSASHPSYAPASTTVHVDPLSGPADVRVVLQRGGRIEGIARDRGGRALVGYTIFTSTGPSAGNAGFPTTAADGSFVIDHVPAGRAQVILMMPISPGQLINGAARDIDVREGESIFVELTARDVIVSGQVTRFGSAMAGTDLTFQHQGTSVVSIEGPSAAGGAIAATTERNHAVTGSDGSFRLSVSEPGRYTVFAQDRDRRSLPSRTVDIPDTEAFSIALDYSGVAVSGVVVEKEHLQPIRDAYVRAVSVSETRDLASATTASGADGRFELMLDPMQYILSVDAHGHVSARQPVDVGDSGISDLRVELATGREISGRVVDTNGATLVGAAVRVVSTRDPQQISAPATTGWDGRFTVRGLGAGSYVLCAAHEAGGFSLQTGVEAGTRDVTLVTKPGGRIRLAVRGAEGAPVKGASFELVTLDGVAVSAPLFGRGLTDDDGQTEVTSPAGLVEIEVFHELRRTRIRVAVESGRMAEAEVRLAGAGTLKE